MAKTLTRTSIAVTINGNDYSKYVMFPFKVSNLLDEQLDEASLTLVGVPEKNFKPLTDVTITLTNVLETQIYHMLVASDKSDEIPTGSGKYKHELYLIEQTKYLECFIVRSIGYLNPLEKSYDVVQAPYFANYTLSKGDWSPEYDAEFLTPQYITGNSLKITAPPLCRNYSLEDGICIVPNHTTSFLVRDSKDAKISLKKDGIVLQEYTTDWELVGNEIVYNSYQVVFEAVDFYVDSPGLYQIEYSNFFVTITFDGTQVNTGSLIYDIAVLENTPTRDKWNARTVIRRALIIAETLLQGEEPRFKLDGDIPYYDNNGNQIEFLGDFDTLADLETAYPSSNIGDLAWVVNATSYGSGLYRYSANGWELKGGGYPLIGQALELQKIETPEFQFTQSTLREVLQSVGKFIHAEPRLDGKLIIFDKLGSGELSSFSETDYASKGYQQAVDRYATNLYSTVDNFVNSINYANGVMVEPYSNGLKTVRTEDTYTKVTDDNIYISTQYPIRSIVKVECGLAEGFENQISVKGGFVDITSFVYESAEYKRLSSYNGAYPMSKAWAIYYTIGQKGINGLNFKPESALLKEFQKYAIVNILNAVTNNSQTETTEQQLAFRVTYEPIYSATAQQNKSYVGDIDKPASLVYNQGQNLVESHYYGENLKGAIARLGNVDKVLTYVKHGLVDAPKVGQILMDGNDEYYISAVASEIQPYYTKFSMSLSKDFNRYSDYVGVNSQKRMYEVSERQAFDSHITYKDYVVIGDIEVYKNGTIDDGLVKLRALNGIFSPNNNVNNGLNSLSLAELQGYDNGGNALQKVALPIQKSAIGNSALFTIKYQDNYSAGDNVVKVDNNYWQNGVAYSDYFGNIESLEMTLRKDGVSPSNYAEQSAIGNALPLYDFEDDENDQWISTKNVDKRLWIKKGSTEIPTIDYQIDFVTNRSDIIIGSALAKNLPLICGDLGAEHNAKLYLLKHRINKFDKVVAIDQSEDVEVPSFGMTITSGSQYGFFMVTANVTETYNAWAIVDGATNELLIGCNKTITKESDIFLNSKLHPLKIFVKHDIYKDKI